MKTISRYIMTLALLLTAVGGAWAQSSLNVVELALPAEWQNDNTQFTAGDLPGFKAVTSAEAQAWTGAPAEGKAVLFYAFDGNDAEYILFNDGKGGEPFSTPFVKSDFYHYSAKYYYTAEPAPGTVTLNDTKTEATMTMPTYDVNFSYELVRDMSVQMQAQVGDDATKQPRYRVQWNDEKDTFEPAEMDMMQVLELFSVYDGIEGTTVAPKNYFVSIYAVDDEGKPTGDAMNFKTFTFAPGRYCVTASANTLLDEPVPYEGTTAPSNIFELYQGYEVTVAAGEYATFYKDENLYVEDADAELYTIASVTDTEAQLSDAIKVAPAETPLLVYNKSEQDKTFLLIPTTDKTPDNVTAATQFVGTLDATTIPASTTGADYYALNGYAFVWVKDAIGVGANKCWLQIGDQPAAARAMTRSIVGGGDTTNMDDVRWQMEDGNYYDLQGRKVEKPNRKGIYIHNGKKVIVR